MKTRCKRLKGRLSCDRSSKINMRMGRRSTTAVPYQTVPYQTVSLIRGYIVIFIHPILCSSRLRGILECC